jgi:hypothetical protein
MAKVRLPTRGSVRGSVRNDGRHHNNSMSDALYCGRHSVSIENSHLRVTVLREGGHIAEILDKQTGVNPLWTPPWPSIEPSAYDPAVHNYGAGPDAQLLAGIMGHNLCLDVFGGPSPEEAAAGITPHGEASVALYTIEQVGARVNMRASLPLAQLRFERVIELQGRTVRIHEAVDNLSATDRPIAWTQHVSLGPPFLEKGATELRMSATRSKVFETEFGSADYLRAGAKFDWPMAPKPGGDSVDLRILNDSPASSAYTAHLMDPVRDAFFLAFAPQYQLAFGYIWKRSDFPWLGMWEENCSRTGTPWNGRTLARGMEFGVSPMPESRRQMIDRNRLFGVPTYRWLGARSRIELEYVALTWSAGTVPEFAPIL